MKYMCEVLLWFPGPNQETCRERWGTVLWNMPSNFGLNGTYGGIGIWDPNWSMQLITVVGVSAVEMFSLIKSPF